MKRRWIAFLLFCVLLLTLAAACGRRNNVDNNGTDNGSNHFTNPTIGCYTNEAKKPASD